MKHKPLTNRMIKFWEKQEFTFEVRKVDPFSGKDIKEDKPRTFFDKSHYMKVLIGKGVRSSKPSL